MSWSVPVPATTGELYTAARYNTDVVDNLNFLKASLGANGHPIDQVVVHKTSTYTIADTDDFVIVDSGTFVVTLPTAVARSGRTYQLKNAGTGTITMASASQIDNASAGLVVLYPGDAYAFESDGTGWFLA